MPPKIDNIVWDTPEPNEITWDAAPAKPTAPPAQPYQRQPIEAIDAAFSEESPYSAWAAQHPKEALESAKGGVATGIEAGAQVLGAGLGALTSPVTGPFGAPAGGILGYTGGRQLTGALGLREPEPVLSSAGTGALYELGGRAVGAGVSKFLSKPQVKAPSIDELKQSSNALREQMYGTGQTYDIAPLQTSIQDALASATPRYPVRGIGMPETQTAVNYVDQILNDAQAGRAVKVDDLEHLNTMLNDAIKRGGRDGLYAMAAKNKLNEFMSSAGGETGALWEQARKLEAKQFRSQGVKDIVTSAEQSPKATSAEIRKSFSSIANDAKQMKLYTPEQQQVIKQIADGSATEKTLETIGKMAPKSVGFQKILTLLGYGGAALGGAAIGGPVGAGVALTAFGSGAAARGAANALAKSRVNMLDELIRGGQLPQRIPAPMGVQLGAPAGINALLSTLSQPSP